MKYEWPKGRERAMRKRTREAALVSNSIGMWMPYKTRFQFPTEGKDTGPGSFLYHTSTRPTTGSFPSRTSSIGADEPPPA